MGLLSNWPQLYDVLPRHLRHEAVFFLSETKLADSGTLRVLTARDSRRNEHRLRGMRYILCNRLPSEQQRDTHPATHDSPHVIISGGVAAATFNRNIKMHLLHHHHAGAMAIALSSKGFDDVAVINVYNPPASSKANTTGATNTDPGTGDSKSLLAIVEEWHAQLSRKYRTVILCGDWNMRPGKHRNHNTPDCKPSGGRTRLFRSFMDRRRLHILHGSHGQVRAHMTSRVITSATAKGTAEVDAFLVPRRPHRHAARILAMPLQVRWSHLPSTMTHVPVCALLKLRPTSRSIGPSSSTRMPRPIKRLAYGDPRHIIAAPLVASALSRAAALVGSATPDVVNTTLVQGLQTAAHTAERKFLTQAGRRLQYGSQQQHFATADDLNLRIASRSKSRADKKYRRIRRTLGTRPDNDIDPATQAELQSALLARKQAEKDLRTVRRRVQSARLNAYVRMLEMQRVRDPSAFFRSIDALSMADLYTAPNDRSAASLDDLFQFYRNKFTCSGPPPPACNGSWDQWIPKARDGSGERLITTVTWWEVYLLLYPADKRMLEFFEPCCAGCTLCTEYEGALRRWDPEDPDSDTPEWKPSLHTCRAAGGDGILAELLRFTRTKGDNWDYRREASVALASVLDHFLHNGVPRTEGFREVLISTPAKPLKPGAPPPVDPAANTRPISVEVLMAKLFELLLNSRTEHWRFNENLVGPQQAAFSQFLSPEHHVLVLRELIQMRRAEGKGANVLFVDFKSAYDSVHHDLLWHILSVMGFPPQLINVLRDWLGSRVGRIKLDGELSEPFPMTMGVPQGGPLSTTLWNLFIEPLSRRLAHELPGVRVRAPRNAHGVRTCDDFHVTHLLFADDLAVPTCTTQKATRHALRVTAEWAAAFGVAINDGIGKTEAMHFAATPSASLAALPKLQPVRVSVAGGHNLAVRWVEEYRYLGAGLRLDLDVSAALQKRIHTLSHIVDRFFMYNNVTSRLSCRAQLQLFNTLALGAVNYLLAVLPASKPVARAVDVQIARVGHRIFGAPLKSISALVASEMPGMPFHSTWTMHQVRLLETLRLTPLRDCLAAKLVRFQTRANPKGHRLNHVYVPFVKRVQAELNAMCRHDGRGQYDQASRAIAKPAPTQRYLIHRQVSIFRRAYGLQAARKQLAIGAYTSSRLQLSNVITAATRPPSTTPAHHLSVLYYGGQHERPSDLGESIGASPLSIAGPLCGGSLLTVTTLNWRSTQPIIRLRTGRVCFAHAPFFSPRHHRNVDNLDATDAENNSYGSRVAYYSTPDSCDLCDTDDEHNSDDGPWHLFFECMHPTVTRLRMRLFSSMPRMLKQLLDRVHEAFAVSRHNLPPDERIAQKARLAELLTDMDWYSVDGKHVIYHMLTALPWPERAANQAHPATPLSAWLGRLFDTASFQRRHRRRIANHIIKWAYHWITSFAELRTRLLHTRAA